MADLSRKTASIYINHQSAQDALVSLQANADKLTQKITAGQAAGKNMVNEIKKLDSVNVNIKSVQDQIAKGLQPTFNQLQSTVTKLRNELKSMSADAPGWAAKFAAFKTANADLQQMSANMGTVKGSLGGLTGDFGNLLLGGGLGAGLLLLGDKVKEFFTSAIEESNKYEDSIIQLKNSLQNVGRSDLVGVFEADAKRIAAIYKALNPADINDVFTKLVDYGKLTKTQITDLTGVIINFAQKQKISLQDATDVFTKALEGNSKGLKSYGINVKDGTTVTERFGIIMDQLAPKVKGAEAAFETGTRGGIAEFKESIIEAGRGVGDFLKSIVEAPKSANEIFDQAKDKVDGYTNSLAPLLQRYDELKSKANLNKDEQKELHGIIQEIVDIMPDAASGVDKYGNALDINRGKVDAFFKSNKQFLAEKEFDAVNEGIQNVSDGLTQLNKLSDELNKGYSTSSGRIIKLTDDDRAAITGHVRSLQESIATGADLLKNKYGKDLPKDLQGGVDKIKSALNEMDDAAKKSDQYEYNFLTTQIKKLTDSLSGLKKGSDEYISVQNKIADLTKQRSNINAVIGNGDPDADAAAKKKADEEAKRAEERLKELLAHRQEFNEALNEIKLKNEAASVSDNDREIQEVKNKYSKLIEEAEKYWNQNTAEGKAKIAEITALQTEELNNLSKKQFEKGSDQQYKESLDEITTIADRQKQLNAQNYIDGKITKQQYEKEITQIDSDATASRLQTAKGFAAYSKTALADVTKFANEQQKQQTADEIKESEKRKKQQQDDALASAELKVINSPDGSKAHLDAQKDLLKLQRQQEEENTDETANMKLLKETELNKALQKLDKDYLLNKGQQYLSAAQDIFQVEQLFTAQKDQEDQNQIDSINNNANTEKIQFQNLLNSKLISQDNYNKKVAALDAQVAKQTKILKLQQFNRDKQAEIVQAEISGAQAILSALANPNFIMGLILAAVATVKTAEQINAIKSKQAPQFGKGGIPDGPLHSEGGMPVINPRTGRKVAEIEGGEPILSRKTYANNKQLVDSLLYSSMYKSGASIKPFYKTRPYQAFNYQGVNNTIGKMQHYQRGGVFTAQTSVVPANTVPFDKISDTLDNINNSLLTPQRSYVLYSDINAAADLDALIKNETTLVKK